MPCDKREECEAEICVLHQETGSELQSDQLDDQHCLAEQNGICHTASTNEGIKYNMLIGKDAVASISHLQVGKSKNCFTLMIFLS